MDFATTCIVGPVLTAGVLVTEDATGTISMLGSTVCGQINGQIADLAVTPSGWTTTPNFQVRLGAARHCCGTCLCRACSVCMNAASREVPAVVQCTKACRALHALHAFMQCTLSQHQTPCGSLLLSDPPPVTASLDCRT